MSRDKKVKAALIGAIGAAGGVGAADLKYPGAIPIPVLVAAIVIGGALTPLLAYLLDPKDKSPKDQ